LKHCSTTRHIIDSYQQGTKRSPGIQQIDNLPVSIEERVAAVAEFEGNNFGEINKTRWRLCIYESLHGAITSNALTNIKHLALANCHLYFVNLFSFSKLEYLDLSGNPLREVYGIQKANQLQVLNLSGCPNLQLDDTLKRLSRLRRLVKV
jgi:Leucine-rich repeat (LRR) protein